MRRLRLLSCVLTTCCLTSCGLSVGPQTKTEIVIVYPGHPCRVVENRKVKVLPEGASQPVMQDLGGGIWMPSEHFDALMRSLESGVRSPEK